MDARAKGDQDEAAVTEDVDGLQLMRESAAALGRKCRDQDVMLDRLRRRYDATNAVLAAVLQLPIDVLMATHETLPEEGGETGEDAYDAGAMAALRAQINGHFDEVEARAAGKADATLRTIATEIATRTLTDELARGEEAGMAERAKQLERLRHDNQVLGTAVMAMIARTPDWRLTFTSDECQAVQHHALNVMFDEAEATMVMTLAAPAPHAASSAAADPAVASA